MNNSWSVGIVAFVTVSVSPAWGQMEAWRAASVSFEPAQRVIRFNRTET